MGDGIGVQRGHPEAVKAGAHLLCKTGRTLILSHVLVFNVGNDCTKNLSGPDGDACLGANLLRAELRAITIMIGNDMQMMLLCDLLEHLQTGIVIPAIDAIGDLWM